MSYRYTRWDGTQRVDPFTADDVLERVADHILEGAELRRALQRLLQRGAQFSEGRRMLGLQDLLEQLREARSQRLGRYNLDSVLDEIRERLDRVLATERRGIQRRLDSASLASGASRLAPEGPEPGPGIATPDPPGDTPDASQEAPDARLTDLLESIARKRLEQLDQLPPDVGGRIQQLRDYEFMDPQASRQFQELLEMLQRQVMQSYFRGLQQSIQAMTPETLGQMQQMVRDLNRLLQQRLQGEATDFEFREFMQRWGQFFPNDIQNVEQLAEHMQRQMAQMESLLNSMTPEMRRELEQMLDALFQDSQLRWDLAQLAANLQRLSPGQQGWDPFPFGGNEPLSLQQAMQLMGEMNGLDRLEHELLEAVRHNDASSVDSDEIGRLLGAEAQAMLEQMQQLTHMLEQAGLIQRRGEDWELTPRAMRKIAERALREVFGRLQRDVFGNHRLDRAGMGVERLDETRPYTFGDPFLIDAQRSVLNGLWRDGPGTPVRLRQEDFEVYRTTELTQCSTVIMLDMSYSMMLDGRFLAGRKVALALDSLIRSQFPRDNLYVVAFSYFVLPLKPEMLLDTYWIEYGGGTNFQEALRQARLLLSRHKAGTRQVLMVTDGEPTSYGFWSGGDREWGGAGGSRDGLEETLREVTRCTREGITVNTFMMSRHPGASRFVTLMARLNRGRAFFATPDRLGEYVLLDYLGNKRKVVR